MMKNDDKEKLTDQVEKIIDNLVFKKAIPKPSFQERKLLVADIMKDMEKNLKNPSVAVAAEKDFNKFLVLVVKLHLMVDKNHDELKKLGYTNDSLVELLIKQEKEMTKEQEMNLVVLKQFILSPKFADKSLQDDFKEVFDLKSDAKHEKEFGKESTPQSEDAFLSKETDADKSNIQRFGAKPETGSNKTVITRVVENAFGMSVSRVHDIDTPIEQTLKPKDDEPSRKSPFDIPKMKPPGIE